MARRAIAKPPRCWCATAAWRRIARGDVATEVAPPGCTVERGAFLMPGLVDAHVHLFLDGAPTDATTRRAPQETARRACRCGAGQRAPGPGLRRHPGARCGRPARHQPPHPRREPCRRRRLLPRPFRRAGRQAPEALRRLHGADVEDDAAIRESVAALARDNDEIKLILTGIIDFDAGAVTDEPQFSLDEAAWWSTPRAPMARHLRPLQRRARA
jgi:hypothetical protein